MNHLSGLYFNIQSRLFPMVEEEVGRLTQKQQEFLKTIELIRPSRFMTGVFAWSGIGRRFKNRENIFRAFLLKAIYDLPTTKFLVENLKSNRTWRFLCGWEYPSQVPSESTFSRVFQDISQQKLLDKIQHVTIVENHKNKIVGHESIDSTAIKVREKSCRKKKIKKRVKKKKGGRKSKSELLAIQNDKLTEIKTRRLALQPNRSFNENLADLPIGCDWGGKRNSKGKNEYWCGYKLHNAIKLRKITI